MKVVKFYGGLGNQMFQYAMLVALRERWGEPVLMDTSLYSTYNLHNGFELSQVFNITEEVATPEQVKQLSRYTTSYSLARLIHYLLPTRKTEFREWSFGKYYPEALERHGDMAYDGYWQHHEYFNAYRSSVMKEFTLREPLDETNAALMSELKTSPKTVSVHVRRGDYLNKKIYRGLCGADYYRQAITKAREIVGEDAGFYFFSNDIAWCRENLADLMNAKHFHVVDWNTGPASYKDMILMGGCRVNIVANSSFSWWGAYLNTREDRVGIAPNKWINKDNPDPIQLPEWIKL